MLEYDEFSYNYNTKMNADTKPVESKDIQKPALPKNMYKDAPLECTKCQDKPNVLCKHCGCGICAGKNQPELLILCDECDQGFHTFCLQPTLDKVPEDDWYCAPCKKDTNKVVAPGDKNQQRKPNKEDDGRDWGRGVACTESETSEEEEEEPFCTDSDADPEFIPESSDSDSSGKTHTSAMPDNIFGPIPETEVGKKWRYGMQVSESERHRSPVSGIQSSGKSHASPMPANHFGPIPGTEVGMKWRYRMQLSESGIHRPPVSGIHGRDVEGAFSIVLSGGYEDDYDEGNEFTYTGSGGRDLSGNKRTAIQSKHQTLTRENKALARNCAVKVISEKGADSKDKWREGKPVRVVRSYKMLKLFPNYAPKEGFRYDGIYKVVKYYPEVGKSGFRVWKYLLRRDEPNPAPWEEGAKEFPIINPVGYLEAETEKLAHKKGDKMKKTPSEGRLPLRENNKETESTTPPTKKIKLSKEKVKNKLS